MWVDYNCDMLSQVALFRLKTQTSLMSINFSVRRIQRISKLTALPSRLNANIEFFTLDEA